MQEWTSQSAGGFNPYEKKYMLVNQPTIYPFGIATENKKMFWNHQPDNHYYNH